MYLFGKNGDQPDNTIDNLLLQGLHFRPLVDPIILGKLETFPKGLSIHCQVKKFTGLYDVSLLSRFRDFSLYKKCFFVGCLPHKLPKISGAEYFFFLDGTSYKYDLI